VKPETEAKPEAVVSKFATPEPSPVGGKTGGTGLEKDEKGDVIKNIEVPNEANEISGFSEDIANEVTVSIKSVENEYNLMLDEITVKGLSDEYENVPFQFQTDMVNNKSVMHVVINKKYDFNGNLAEFNERILSGYQSNYLASKNVKNLIEHEMAHVLTYQNIPSNRWQIFDGELREEFVKGISKYADQSKDCAESIAEAFVRTRNGEKITADAQRLLDTYIEKWRK